MADNAPAVNEAVVTQDATPTGSAPVETTVPEVAEQSAFSKAMLSDDDSTTDVATKAETTEETSTEEPQQATDETQNEEQPLRKADERKTQLNGEIRDLVAQRNAIRQEVEQLNSQVYQPASEQELVDQGLSPEMAAIEAMKQERDVERYNNQMAEAQLTLNHESQRVLQEFPMFNPDSEQFNPTVATEATKLLQANLITDPNTGQIIGSHISPYQLYSTIAAAAKVSQTEGQIQGQRNTEKMLANVDTAPGSAPAKKAVDPFRLGFNSDD